MKPDFQNETKQCNKACLLMSAAVLAGKETIDSAYHIDKRGQYAFEALQCIAVEGNGSKNELLDPEIINLNLLPL